MYATRRTPRTRPPRSVANHLEPSELDEIEKNTLFECPLCFRPGLTSKEINTHKCEILDRRVLPPAILKIAAHNALAIPDGFYPAKAFPLPDTANPRELDSIIAALTHALSILRLHRDTRLLYKDEVSHHTGLATLAAAAAMLQTTEQLQALLQHFAPHMPRIHLRDHRIHLQLGEDLPF